jgi:glycosyltransferase involved in cell wall biosynthesis
MRNAEKHLDECLSSVDYNLARCIVIDDNSDDRSVSIAKKYNTMLIQNKVRLGQGCAKNICLDYVSDNPSKYVMFLDSDDYYSPKAIEKMLNAVDKDNLDLAVCNTRTFGEFKRNYGKLKLKGIHLLDSHTSILTPCVAWNKIYSLDSLKNIRFSGTIPEDNPFWFKYCCRNHGIKVNYLDETLYNYRQSYTSSYNSTESPYYNAVDSSFDIYDWVSKYTPQYLTWYFETYFLQMIKTQIEKTDNNEMDVINYALDELKRRTK